MLKRSLLVLSSVVSFSALSAWQLDTTASSLHFLSTKNAQVTEVHQFNELSGSVDKSGKLTVTVSLSSVNTGIAIRDTRMQEMLFEVASFADATFTATLPENMVNVDKGASIQGKVEGELMLHGTRAPASFDVVVSKLDDATLQVSTVAPTLINAEDFGLKEGVQALKKVAGLKSISTTVPVTFSTQFTQSAD